MSQTIPFESTHATLHQEIISLFSAQNRKVRILSVSHLPQIAATLNERYARGEFDAAFFKDELRGFDFSLPTDRDYQSLIVIATPMPPIPVIFHYRQKVYSLLVPPTYAGYKKIPLELETGLNMVINSCGYGVKRARIPFKLTVTSSGLAKYGRNNLCYIDGFGSFFELEAFYSDMPYWEDHWQEPQVLDRCSVCTACVKLCPTKAISPDRFLLHAERCLTYLNERPGEIPFPEWIKSTDHNALIGCMICQVVCPENQTVKKWQSEPVVFTENETGLLLQGKGPASFSEDLFCKLEQIGLVDSWDLFPRNLGTFIN
jgi:epoxyqueuosine reductase